METRANQKIFLIDHDESQIIGCKLPSRGQILKVLFYNLRKIKLDLRSSAYLVVKEAEVLWNKARIPTRRSDCSVEKVEALYQQWKTLQKTCKRRTPLQEQRELDFMETMDDLFDIAHSDVLNIIKIEEDKMFLINQRKKGRPGALMGSDRVLFEKEKRRNIREEKGIMRKEKYELEQAQNFATNQNTSDEERSPIDIDVDEGEDIETSYQGNFTKKRKRGMRHFITAKLVATLDKCKVSDRDAVRILLATAEALNHNVSQLVISKTSIRLCRKQMRSETGIKLMEDFLKKDLEAVSVHWDGKLLPSIDGRGKVDRLPVVITSEETEQLLGIPALQSGTGKEQADAIIKLLKEWNLAEKVQTLCFDTTATNTGRFQGTCVILEQVLEKDLLYLPCRHHIYEIVLRNVFEKTNFHTTGPTLSIFQRFKASWSTINRNNFKIGIMDERVKSAVTKDELEHLVDFANRYVKNQHPRADYKEILELTLIFFGHSVANQFKAPGALHHARWMSKAIYALKIFLFREEFSMSSSELEAIRECCLFIVKVYLKSWIEAPIAAKAPLQDLNFIKALLDYRKINKTISEAAVTKFCNHLWYLAPESIGLSFFDATIGDKIKTSMVNRLNTETENDVKKLMIGVDEIATKNIADLVSKTTYKFFERFSISTDFLKIHPAHWQNDPGFKIGLKKISCLHVVNDTAERNVKLMEEYSKALSNNEEEKQFILRSVSDYRKHYASTNKSDLAS